MIIVPKPLEDVKYNDAYLDYLRDKALKLTIQSRTDLQNATLFDYSALGAWSFPTGFGSVTNITNSYDNLTTTFAVMTRPAGGNDAYLEINFNRLISVSSVVWTLVSATAGNFALAYGTDGINWAALDSWGGALTRNGSVGNFVCSRLRLSATSAGAAATLNISELRTFGRDYNIADYNPLM